MLSILENDISRKLTILDNLYKSNRHISIAEMIELLNCTRKTLSKDITSINAAYDVVEYHREKGFFFNKTKGVNFYFFYCTYLRESLHVEVLRLILIEELSIVKISRRLFMSESKTRRLIDVWNQYFNERNFDFLIKTSADCTMILGNETQIRWFNHTMLFELEYIDIYEFKLQESREYGAYKSVLKNDFFDSNTSEHEKIKSFFYVKAALYRTNKGHVDNNEEVYLSFGTNMKNNTLIQFENIMAIETGVYFTDDVRNQILPKYYFPSLCEEIDSGTSEIMKIINDVFDYILTTEESENRYRAEKKVTLKMNHLHKYGPEVTYFLLDFVALNYKTQQEYYFYFYEELNKIVAKHNFLFESEKQKQLFYKELVLLLNVELSLPKYVLKRPRVTIYLFASHSTIQSTIKIIKSYFGDRIELRVADCINDKLHESDLIISNYFFLGNLEAKKVHFQETIDLKWLYLLDSKLKKIYKKLNS